MENRQYYDVYFPYASVDVGQRFFFFNSLANTKLGGDVYKILNSNINQVKVDNDEGLSIINGAMDFLYKMIEDEKKNEQEYYTINIINNEKLPSSLRNKCKTLFSNDSFNYVDFINIINEYYTGLDNYKQNLNYESTRLHKLQALYDKFNQYYTQNIDETYTVQTKNKKTQEFENKDVSFYVAFRDFLLQGVKKEWITKADQLFGFNTKTIANTIQNQLSSIYNQIWNNADFRTQIETAVLNQGMEGQEEKFTLYLIQEFLAKSQGEIADFFSNNNEYKFTLNKTETEQLAKEFISQLKIEPGETVNDALERELLLSIQREAAKLGNENFLENSTSRILKELDNDITISVGESGGYNNLSQDIINLVQKILAEKKKKTSVSSKKVWNKDDLLRALNDAFPEQQLKIKAKKYNKQKVAEVINSQIRGQKLLKIKISEKDNIISEGFGRSGLAQASNLLGRIKRIFMTYGTQKADVAGIELGKVEIIPNTNINWNKIADMIVNNYLQSLKIDNNIEINTKNIKFNEGKFRKENNFGVSEFSIEAETMRRMAIKEQEIEKLETILKKKKMKADEIQQVLNTLKDNVQIGDTVKSYNKYDNKHGFHGGSIGGSVESQLKNIYKMFDYGGISASDLPDLNWLTFVIYNAGPGLLGSYLQEPVENILSTVGVMLMFDDAGQQAMYLNEQIKQNYSQYNSSKFLHLYQLNGQYYPSSFILQLTYNGLLKAYELLDRKYLKGTESFNNISNGSRANIINPVTEKSEVGTEIKNDTITTKQEQWSSTFTKNAKSVKIQITFLAGMLDIIDVLNKNLQ